MPMYKIADLYVDLDVDGTSKKNAEAYICDLDAKPNIYISGNFDDALKLYPRFNNYDWPLERKKLILNYMYERDLFSKSILDFNGMVLHSSAVVVDDKAYLFSAPPGTGKSTHTKFWLDLFGERAFILNDDMPAIRIVESSVYAYGTPWCGSTNISTNAKAILSGICFLTRDETNWIKTMDEQTAVVRLLHAGFIKMDKDSTIKMLDFISELIKRVPIYEMGCTPDITAAKLSYQTMSNSEVTNY